MIRSHRDLEVWQRALDLAQECYRVSSAFPRSELYGLTLQLRKSAGSVPANIAEGRGRRTTKEFIRFIDIAYGSLMELETHMELARRLDFCETSQADAIIRQSALVGRMLNSLRTSLQAKIL
ncbi:MAG: four helix bundle protein [Gemmatimonadetes bacterium]|nr:four helix bundle protein [Gemmatimonadota bacterium]